jgi:outer membrane protein
MKKLIVAAVMGFGIFFNHSASAQVKVGYISLDELIGVMPEAEKADGELKEYQASLAQQGQDMMKELGDKDSLFVRDSAKLSPSMKEIKRNELIALYQRVQNWNQQAQDMYQQEAQKKIAPLKDKALETIKNVAKENGYSYVLDATSVIVGPPGDDLIGLVKKKMGIKDTPAVQKPATTPKKP